MITDFKIFENNSDDYNEKDNLDFKYNWNLDKFKIHLKKVLDKFGGGVFDFKENEKMSYRIPYSYSKAEWVLKDLGKPIFEKYVVCGVDDGICMDLQIRTGIVYLKKPIEVKERYGRIRTVTLSREKYEHAHFYPSPFQYKNIKETKNVINYMINEISLKQKLDNFGI